MKSYCINKPMMIIRIRVAKLTDLYWIHVCWGVGVGRDGRGDGGCLSGLFFLICPLPVTNDNTSSSINIILGRGNMSMFFSYLFSKCSKFVFVQSMFHKIFFQMCPVHYSLDLAHYNSTIALDPKIIYICNFFLILFYSKNSSKRKIPAFLCAMDFYSIGTWIGYKKNSTPF